MPNSQTLFLLSILLVLICSCSVTNPKDAQKTPPNILLIMTDDQGWGDLRSHGNDSIFTPQIDALAAESCRFDRFFVSPVCAPTRASLLTGRYHLRTGTSWVTHRKEVMRSEETTLAEIFKSAGYATGCFGKWHNGEQFPNNPKGQGFDEFFGFAAGHWNNYFDTKLTHNDKEVKTEGFITDALTDHAIDFIQQHNSKKPFFCYVPFNAPHSPFQVPDKYFAKYKKMGLTDKNASVHGMVENIDDNVGRLLQTLDELHISENTIVIFLTDNGPNGKRFNGAMRGTKASVHEGGVRVPCFIRWKGQLPDNQLIRTHTAHIDILPTLADLCEIQLPEKLQLDGKSLKPLLENNTTEWTPRHLYSIQNNGKNQLRNSAVRTDQYRMIIDHDGNSLLFDMIKDPSQKNDIASTFPQLADSLKSDLQNWFDDVTKDGIDPSIAKIGFRESIVTNLPAPESQLEGNVKFEGKMGWANDYIIDWKNKNDQATWKVDVVEDGNYQIFLNYNCSKEFIPSSFQVRCEKVFQRIKIGKAADFKFLPSPDRVKRGEVYEKKWASLDMGILNLVKGETEFVVSLLEDRKGGWFELKGLTVKRMD